MKKILELLRDEPWQNLTDKAGETLLKHKGSHVFVRGLIEFSNICRRNCVYCGLNANNRHIQRYCMDGQEILRCAQAAKDCGCDTIVLQSGENECSAQWLAEIVAEITGSLGLPVTLSVGERKAWEYALWRETGASRYLIKHETADEALYARLHPGHALGERLDSLRLLRKLGYEIGSGFMIGLPGQDLASLAADIALCRDVGVDMCGAGPFIPHPDTALASAPPGSAKLVLRCLAVMRIIMPWANLPATTALATVDPQNGQVQGLQAGANALMPSFTPAPYSGNYAIYNNKNRVACANAAKAIERAGRTHRLKI